MKRLLAPFAIVAAALLFFLPLLASGALLAPGDGIAQNFPMRVLAAEALKHGEFPFWNPYNFGGAPLFAALQPGVLFPGNWTFLVLPPVPAMHLTILIAFWTAGLGIYAYSRALALPRAAGLVAALSYMLGGFLVLNEQHVIMIQVAGLAPWLLWAIERFARTLEPRYPLGGAILAGLMVLAGHPQMTAYGMGVAGLYAVWRLGAIAPAHRLPYVVSLAMMFALGVGLSLAQLLPAVDFVRMSQRQDIAYSRLVADTPPLFGLPGLLFPSILGSRTPSPFLSEPLWPPGPWRFWLQGYAGVGTLVLAGVALTFWKRQPAVTFWAPVAALSLVLAMGDHTPLYRVWALLPVLNQMPYPHRHLVEFNMAIAMLGGLGLAAFLGAPARAARRRLSAAAALIGLPLVGVIVGVAVFGPAYAARTQPLLPPGVDVRAALTITQPTFWLPALLWGLTVVLLWRYSRRPAHGWLAALVLALFVDLGVAGYHNGYWRVAPAAPQVRPSEPQAQRTLSVPVQAYPYFRSLDYLEAMGLPSLSNLAGTRSVNGYDAFLYRRHAEVLLMNSAGQMLGDAPWRGDHHALDLLAARELRLDTRLLEQAGWGDRLASPRWKKVSEAEGVAVYENARALPRAWRVSQVQVLDAEHVDARVTGDASFEPRKTALVEAPVEASTLTAGTAAAETVSLNRIRLATSGAGPGFVVVSESFDPGWRAFLGDRELPVHRTDALVLGVQVPSGDHVIELRYEPRFWKAGLAGSGVSLLLLLGWALYAKRRKRLPG